MRKLTSSRDDLSTSWRIRGLSSNQQSWRPFSDISKLWRSRSVHFWQHLHALVQYKAKTNRRSSEFLVLEDLKIHSLFQNLHNAAQSSTTIN